MKNELGALACSVKQSVEYRSSLSVGQTAEVSSFAV